MVALEALLSSHADSVRPRPCSSVVKRLFLPLFRVEPHERVVGFHFDPAHLVGHVDPALRLEGLGSADLGTVVRHVVEDVEKHGFWEDFDR